MKTSVRSNPTEREIIAAIAKTAARTKATQERIKSIMAARKEGRATL
jgi:hypothetical protein